MKFRIWSEGYLATGMEGIPAKAQFEGEFEGETFADACKAWAKTLQNPKLFNEEDLTFWGCKLFDNEEAARESFG